MSDETPDLLKTWAALSKVDDEFTKDYSKSGGKYTSVNTTYNALVMTRHFGPLGQGWGYEVVERWVQEIPDLQSGVIAELHACLRLRLWAGSREDSWDALGQWKLAYMTNPPKEYLKINDEAWISAETRALSKGFSRLGLAADVYLDKEFSEADHEPSQRAARAPQGEHPAIVVGRRLLHKFSERCDELGVAVNTGELNALLEGLGIDKLDGKSMVEGEEKALGVIELWGSPDDGARAATPGEVKAARLAALQGEGEPEKGGDEFKVIPYLFARVKELYAVEGEKASNMLKNALSADYARDLKKLPASKEAADALLDRLEAIIDGKQVSQ